MASVIHHQERFNHDVYTVEIDGTDVTVTVTASAAVVRRWLNTTLYIHRPHVYRDRLVVGLGVQWTPGRADLSADTLQLCVGRRCLIFQLANADIVPRRLRTFLLNPSYTFVGFWNHSDRNKLERSEHELEMWSDPLDLRLHAETEDNEDLAQASVEEIVDKCLGFEVEQRGDISVSDWDRNLTDDQVSYATVDAYCAFLIGRNSRVWELYR